MGSRVPTVFLSSTYYDLRHLRSHLASFLEGELGFRVLASERHTFPVDPDADTLENCRRRVEEDSDVVVLAIGGRYGSKIEKLSTSVTNLEYRTARGASIPVYAFVEQDVLAQLQLWERSPDADFSGTVENPEVFRFISEVRTHDLHWTFPFATPADIVQTLRVQFAYHTADALMFRRRMTSAESDLSGLSGEALRVCVEQQVGWPPRLFAAVLRTGIRGLEDERQAFEAGVAIGPGETVSEDSIVFWMQSCLEHGIRLARCIMSACDEGLNTALATANIRVIAYSARQLVKAYADALEWSSRVRRAFVPLDARDWTASTALLLKTILADIRSLPSQVDQEVERLAPKVGPERQGGITLTLRPHNLEDVHTAFKKYAAARGHDIGSFERWSV